MPDVDDEVLVVFVQGDPRIRWWWAACGMGRMPRRRRCRVAINQYKRIRSKNGVVVTLDDQQGQEKLVLETPAGQKLTLSDGPGKVRIEDSNGNSVVLESSGITITAAAQVKVDAANVKVTAGMVTVDAAMAKFSGVVKCEVLMATSVVGTSYTPGAGNVW